MLAEMAAGPFANGEADSCISHRLRKTNAKVQ